MPLIVRRALRVLAVQEHYGHTINPGSHADINPILDTPLRTKFLLDKTHVSTTIRFDGNGSLSLRYRLSEQIPIEISPPRNWANSALAWREFRYQLEPDGSIYLLHPSQTPPVKQFLTQPAGFPIRPNASE